jgi:hypothetical protein
MKSLSTHITESFKEGLLKYNFEVLPADWQKFVKNSQVLGFQHTIDKEDELLHNGKVVIARFDTDDMKVYTDLTKLQFYDVAIRKQYKSIESKL